MAIYSPTRKWLHWAIFGLVAFLYLITYAEGAFPRGSAGRAWVWFLHISFGLVLAGLVVWRVALRIGAGEAPPVPGAPVWQDRAARVVHLALYALLVAIPVAGIALAFARGNALSFFGLFTIPSPITPDRALSRPIQGLHEWLANAIVILALGHAAMALWHQFVKKDGVLSRMLPGR